MKKSNVFLLLLAVLVLGSCKKEEEALLPIFDRIEGKWTVKSITLFGINVPDGSSTLTFDACPNETACTGIDYEATTETSGTFEWEFNTDQTELIITDDSSNGGSYNGTWTISSFNNNSLELVQSSGLFGDTKMYLTK